MIEHLLVNWHFIDLFIIARDWTFDNVLNVESRQINLHLMWPIKLCDRTSSLFTSINRTPPFLENKRNVASLFIRSTTQKHQ